MKVLFAGPTLYGSTLSIPDSIQLRGPAAHGDIARAVGEGARVIGLVDGVYENVSAIWHKEILFALNMGVAVLGGASIGALRAAECDSFGMIGVGEIYRQYASGALVDDADVALLHGPAELNYLPVSLSLVNCVATIDHCAHTQLIAEDEVASLHDAARSLFFKDRTWDRLLDLTAFTAARKTELKNIFKQHYVDQKKNDAEMLIDLMQTGQFSIDQNVRPWTFQRTEQFECWIAPHLSQT